MFDFTAIGKIKNGWNGFIFRHPKTNEFINQLKTKNVVPGQEIAIAIRYPDGTELKTGIRLKEEDIDFVETVKKLADSVR